MTASTCHEHGIPLRPACIDGREVIVCHICAMAGAMRYRELTETLPDGTGGPRTTRRARPEEGVQEAILDALAAAGFVVRVPPEAAATVPADVLITSRRRRSCQRCGEYDTRGDGCSPGLPDLLVWSEARGAWLGIEVKGPTTRVSDAQRALVSAGRVEVVRSAEAALEAVRWQEVTG